MFVGTIVWLPEKMLRTAQKLYSSLFLKQVVSEVLKYTACHYSWSRSSMHFKWIVAICLPTWVTVNALGPPLAGLNISVSVSQNKIDLFSFRWIVLAGTWLVGVRRPPSITSHLGGRPMVARADGLLPGNSAIASRSNSIENICNRNSVWAAFGGPSFLNWFFTGPLSLHGNGGRPKAALPLLDFDLLVLGGRPKTALIDERLLVAHSFSRPVAASDLLPNLISYCVPPSSDLPQASIKYFVWPAFGGP